MVLLRQDPSEGVLHFESVVSAARSRMATRTSMSSISIPLAAWFKTHSAALNRTARWHIRIYHEFEDRRGRRPSRLLEPSIRLGDSRTPCLPIGRRELGKLGYSNPEFFSAQFLKIVGVSPSRYRTKL